MKPIIATILDSRHIKKSGKYPVKIRITFLRERKYYPIGVDLTEEEFSIVQNAEAIKKLPTIRLRRHYSDLKMECDAQHIKAVNIIEKLPDFTFKLFERRYYSSQRSTENVYEYYDTVIKKLRQDGRMGTSDNYQCSMNSLKAFSPRLSLRDISVEFLNDYEKWLLAQGKSISTVGIYIRPLRAILNGAIEEGIITREAHYPFGRRRYQIPASKNKKKALTVNEIGRIYYYPAIPGTWHERARDFFLFSYFGNGINMKDIALLRYRDIDGEFIRFVRAKTQHTNRTAGSSITIVILKEMQAIIDRWRNEDSSPDNYLFPILSHGLTPYKEQSLIRQFTKMVNKYLKLITKDVGIEKPVTTYYARHSFATVLRRSGASTEIISESLGHTNIRTTSSYLDSFEDDTRKETMVNLTRF